MQDTSLNFICFKRRKELETKQGSIQGQIDNLKNQLDFTFYKATYQFQSIIRYCNRGGECLSMQRGSLIFYIIRGVYDFCHTSISLFQLWFLLLLALSFLVSCIMLSLVPHLFVAKFLPTLKLGWFDVTRNGVW